MKLKKYQMGGPAPEAGPAPEGAPMEPQGQDQAMEQIAQMAMQIIQELGPDAAAMLAQAIMELLQQASQGQEAAPVFKKGGKLANKKAKKACGGLKFN